MKQKDQTGDSPPDALRSPLCQVDHWRMQRVLGEHPGYLVTLLCVEGHIHYAALPRTHLQAQQLMRRYVRDVFGPEHPPLWIEDVSEGRAILP